MMFIIMLTLIIFLLVCYIIQKTCIYILLGYNPASYSFNNVNNEIRIYHNGLSESLCIDEGDKTKTFYTVIPTYIKFIFWNNDSYLDKWMQHAQLWKP